MADQEDRTLDIVRYGGVYPPASEHLFREGVLASRPKQRYPSLAIGEGVDIDYTFKQRVMTLQGIEKYFEDLLTLADQEIDRYVRSDRGDKFHIKLWFKTHKGDKVLESISIKSQGRGYQEALVRGAPLEPGMRKLMSLEAWLNAVLEGIDSPSPLTKQRDPRLSSMVISIRIPGQRWKGK